jgi:hypothetical protein
VARVVQQFCECGGREPGFVDDAETGLQVHLWCGLPTRTYYLGMAARGVGAAPRKLWNTHALVADRIGMYAAKLP